MIFLRAQNTRGACLRVWPKVENACDTVLHPTLRAMSIAGVRSRSCHENICFAYLIERPRLTGENHVERSLEPHDRVKKLRPPPPWQQAKLHLPVVHACRVTNCTEFSFNKKTRAQQASGTQAGKCIGLRTHTHVRRRGKHELTRATTQKSGSQPKCCILREN